MRGTKLLEMREVGSYDEENHIILKRLEKLIDQSETTPNKGFIFYFDKYIFDDFF